MKHVEYNRARRNMRTAPLIALSLILAACATHAPYETPRVDLPPSLPMASAEKAKERSEPWWQTFDDPNLTKVVDQALSENLQIEAAAARLQQASGAASLAGAQRLPEIGVDASAAEVRQSIADPIIGNFADLPGFNRNQSIYGMNLAASWELDLFGRLAAGERVAVADAASAQAQLIGIRLTIAAETALSYIALAETQALRANATRRIETLEELARVVRLRYERGIAPRLELDQVEADLSSARSTLPVLEAAERSAEVRLLILTGGTPNLDALPFETALIPEAPTIEVSQTPAQLLLARPDLVAAERQVAAADARVAQAVANYYPRFSLSGLLGLLSGDIGDLLTGDAFRAEGAIGAAVPLFDFGRRDAQLAISEAGTAEAIAHYRLAIAQALGEVDTSLISADRERAQAKELARTVTTLDRARETSRLAYQAGAVSLIEALDAERLLLEAEGRLISARAQLSRSTVVAYRSLGVRSVDAGIVDSKNKQVTTLR